MQSIFFSADFLMLCSIIELYNADLNRYFWIEVKILEITNHSNWDNSAEKAMSLHSSTLAWIIPWMEEPGRVRPMVLLRVRHDWVTSFHFSVSCIVEGNGKPLQCSCLENPRDVGWGGRGGGWRLVGCRLGGRTESGHNWSDLAAAAAADNSALSSKSS